MKVGNRKIFGPLEVWSLISKAEQNAGIIRLARFDDVNFGEKPTPEVSRVLATNLSESPLFIPEGFLIEGLKQSRMLLNDSFLQVGATKQISVACVERGRWGHETVGSHFGRAPLSVIAAAREGSVGDNGNEISRIQQRVWNSVEIHRSRVENSISTSLTEVITTYKTQSLQSAKKVLIDYEPGESDRGFVISAYGEPLLMEVFSSRDHLISQFDAIIESLLWDITKHSEEISSRKNIVEFLSHICQLSNSNWSTFKTTTFSEQKISITSGGTNSSTLHSLAINHRHPMFV